MYICMKDVYVRDTVNNDDLILPEVKLRLSSEHIFGSY